MIIGCPSCSTKFGVPDNALGPTGRKVKCAKCSHVWLATIADAKPEPAKKRAPQPPEPEAVQDKVDDNFSAPAENIEPETTPVEPADEHIQKDDFDHDVKDFGNGSVEEALAVIKGSAFEEPDFPLGKGQIKENEIIPKSKSIIIGWASLGVFIITLVVAFFFLQKGLSHTWPPITKLYEMVGMAEHKPEEAAHKANEMKRRDPSEYISITNDATVEALANGTPALVIRGSVSNSADFDINLPGAEIVLRNERRENILVWPFEFDEKTLKAGKTMPFIEAVPKPPSDTTEFELMLLWDK